MMRLLAAFAVSLLLGVAAARSARADILTLDDGTKIEGEIVRQTEDEVEVKIPYGSTTLPRARVVKIEKKASPQQEFEAKRAKLDPKDSAGRIDLARWLLEKRFPREKAAELAIEAWRIAPGDEGAIDVLVTKLDYRLEKDVWVDPEKWYPTHGFVRKGSSFITTEEQTHQDAGVLVAKLKASLGQAARDVERAEKAIADSPARESRARKAVDAAEAQVKSLALKRDTAKTTLEARESDLTIAAARTIAAQRDLNQVQGSPCPADAQGKQVWSDRVTRATALYNLAVVNEDKARRVRDGALGDVEAIATKEQAALDEVGAAKQRAESAHGDTRTAEAALPVAKAARDAAKDRLEQGVASEKAARDAAERRKLLDAKDAADRLAALRALKR